MKSFPIDENIRLAMLMLENHGYKAYIVGGAVRDLLLELPITDYDIVTSATLDEAELVFSHLKTKRYISKGITLGVVINHTHFELSCFKGETLEEDLKNRDFTINAMAYNESEGIIDPYNGIYDLATKTLRSVDDPNKVFSYDPIRILRAIRFSVTKGLQIEENTKISMHACKDMLKECAKERFKKEFDPILLSDTPSLYLREYVDIYSIFIPKLSSCVGFDQKCKKWHNLDVFEHILKVVDSAKCNLTLRLAALFHDICKPECMTIDEKGIGHFYGHAIPSSQYAKEILQLYCYPHKEIDVIEKLIYYHDYPLEINDKSILKFLYKFGTMDLDLYFGLRRADILGQNPLLYDRLYQVDEITKIAKRLMDEDKIITYKNLRIKGNDLLDLGYQNEEVGNALEILLTKVIKKELKNDKDKLIKYAMEMRFHMREIE